MADKYLIVYIRNLQLGSSIERVLIGKYVSIQFLRLMCMPNATAANRSYFDAMRTYI